MIQLNDSEIKYSVLIAGGDCPIESILGLLRDGKKVIWFCSTHEYNDSAPQFDMFREAGFFDVYENPRGVEVIIYDGIDLKGNMPILKGLEHGDTRFNLEQYLIEHNNQKSNIIVEAGAGTGKTHVM